LIHVAAGAAWLGEVVAVVFVLVPVMVRTDDSHRRWLLAHLFPGVFRLASVLIVLALAAGALLNLAMSSWSIDWTTLTGTGWGRSILVGGSFGLALGIFHFVAERTLEPVAVRAGEGIEISTLMKRLRIIPVTGLLVLLVVFALMVFARP
jgi:hypothetical protein